MTVSFASKVVTDVLFSLTDLVLVEAPALPDGPVIVGAEVSTVIDNVEDEDEVLLALSVAVAVKE